MSGAHSRRSALAPALALLAWVGCGRLGFAPAPGAGTNDGSPEAAREAGAPADATREAAADGSEDVMADAPTDGAVAEAGGDGGAGLDRPAGPGGTTGLGPGDCASPRVHCVNDDDLPAGTREYTRIQDAVDVARWGEVVLVFDGRYEGFTVQGSSMPGGAPPAPLTISAHGRSAIVERAAPGASASILVCNASNVVVEGFVVEGDARVPYGIAARCATADAPMRGVVFRFNRVERARDCGIYASQVLDGAVRGNVVLGGRNGICLANSGIERFTVAGNDVSDNSADGINCAADVGDGGDGVQRALTISGNRVHGNGRLGISLDGVQDALLQNNLVHRNGAHAIRAFRIGGAQGPRNLHIVHNTLAANGGWSVRITQDLGGHVIASNVMLSAAGAISVESPMLSSDHNVVEQRSLGGFQASVAGAPVTMNLAEWRALGFGNQTLPSSLEREFVDWGVDDFRLADGAAARNSAPVEVGGVAAPSTDATGAPRPQGPGYDRGALERD